MIDVQATIVELLRCAADLEIMGVKTSEGKIREAMGRLDLASEVWWDLASKRASEIWCEMSCGADEGWDIALLEAAARFEEE